MAESYSKKSKFGDRKILEVENQFVEENISADSYDIPSLDDFQQISFEESCKDCEEIIRTLQNITNEKRLVKNLKEIEIGEVYGEVCLLYEAHALVPEENCEIPSTSTLESTSSDSAALKILSMTRNKIQTLKALEKSSRDSCDDDSSSKSVSMCVDEAREHALTPPLGTEMNPSMSSSSEIQLTIDISYNLELILRLIRYNQEIAEKSAVQMTTDESSNQSAIDSEKNFKKHVEVLNELRKCMLKEVEILKTYMDEFLKLASGASTKCDSLAEDISEGISLATEVQVISSSDSEAKGNRSLKAKIQKVLGIPAAKEGPEGAAASADIEMKDLSSDSAQELPGSSDEQDSMRIPLLESESETANPLQHCSELTLCLKSTQTDNDNENRSTGPCVTEETILSTPDDDTGRSISSIPLDSVSFHSSFHDEQLDTDTEETPL